MKLFINGKQVVCPQCGSKSFEDAPLIMEDCNVGDDETESVCSKCGEAYND
jgi:DNA-directed RNA polymerase subunit RPC12/RpoP